LFCLPSIYAAAFKPIFLFYTSSLRHADFELGLLNFFSLLVSDFLDRPGWGDSGFWINLGGDGLDELMDGWMDGWMVGLGCSDE